MFKQTKTPTPEQQLAELATLIDSLKAEQQSIQQRVDDAIQQQAQVSSQISDAERQQSELHQQIERQRRELEVSEKVKALRLLAEEFNGQMVLAFNVYKRIIEMSDLFNSDRRDCPIAVSNTPPRPHDLPFFLYGEGLGHLNLTEIGCVQDKQIQSSYPMASRIAKELQS